LKFDKDHPDRSAKCLVAENTETGIPASFIFTLLVAVLSIPLLLQ